MDRSDPIPDAADLAERHALRRALDYLARTDLDDESRWLVDDLADLLMSSIQGRGEAIRALDSRPRSPILRILDFLRR